MNRNTLEREVRGWSRASWRILFNVEHLGSHDYMSLNEKLLIKYEYVYHVGVLLKFCLEKISFRTLMSSVSL